VILSWNCISLSNSSFSYFASSSFHSTIYLHALWIHLSICILLNFIDNSYSHSFEMFVWDFVHFAIIRVHYWGVVDFWRSRVALCFFFLFLVFLHLDLHFWSKVVGWRFNHLHTFSWGILVDQAGLGSDRVKVQFLTLLDWGCSSVTIRHPCA
jgi:hypothetical protein